LAVSEAGEAKARAAGPAGLHARTLVCIHDKRNFFAPGRSGAKKQEALAGEQPSTLSREAERVARLFGSEGHHIKPEQGKKTDARIKNQRENKLPAKSKLKIS
jgi:hypothetical protein